MFFFTDFVLIEETIGYFHDDETVHQQRRTVFHDDAQVFYPCYQAPELQNISETDISFESDRFAQYPFLCVSETVFKHLERRQAENKKQRDGEHHVGSQSRLIRPLADNYQKIFVEIIIAIVVDRRHFAFSSKKTLFLCDRYRSRISSNIQLSAQRVYSAFSLKQFQKENCRVCQDGLMTRNGKRSASHIYEEYKVSHVFRYTLCYRARYNRTLYIHRLTMRAHTV